MDIVIGIIVFILILGTVVLIHELGHFLFARKAGILCYEFAFGMGPVLFQKKIGETTYMIKLFPIGGYVQMAGEEIESNPFAKHRLVQIEEVGNVVKKIYLVSQKAGLKDLPVYFVTESDIFGDNKMSPLSITLKKIPSEINVLETPTDDVANSLSNVVETKYEVSRECIISDKNHLMQIAPYERTFSTKTVGQRFMAIFAGPMMNFVLAFILFALIGVIQGYPTDNSTTIDGLVADTPAYNAGLRDGDKIVYISGTKITEGNLASSNYYTKWSDISQSLGKMARGESAFDQVYVYYLRNNVLEEAVVKPNVIVNSIGIIFKSDGSQSLEVEKFIHLEKLPLEMTIVSINETKFNSRSEVLEYLYDEANSEVYIFDLVYTYKDGDQIKEGSKTVKSKSRAVFEESGVEITKVMLSVSPEYQRSFVKTLYQPFIDIKNDALVIFNTLKLLIVDKSVGVSDLSGPVGIATYTIQITQGGIVSILKWTALLSVNLGLFNIIPFPALDGGRLAFLGYEGITKKKPNAKVENIIHFAGFVLFMLLFVVVAFNDILRLFGV